MFFRNRIMSAVQSTALPWMHMIMNLLKLIQPFDFFLILFAFIYGNLFAIHSSSTDSSLFIIFCVVCLLEALNKILYSYLRNHFFFFFIKKKTQAKNVTKNAYAFIPENAVFGTVKTVILNSKNSKIVYLIINIIKRGFLLGFFLEAFKVGS